MSKAAPEWPSAAGPRIVSSLLVLGLALSSACGSRAGSTELDGPNLLLVSIDSLRPDHLGCYGYRRDTSPVIDRLARSGARFETAISTTSWTLPAHAALFTGMYDSAHGLVDNGLSLGDRHRTLAEVLREHGYQTAGFSGGPYLHPTFGLSQGFDHYQSCMTTMADDTGGEEVRQQSRAPIGASHRDVTGPRTVAEFGRWLDGADHQRPFFAFVHLWDVHYDYIPPPEFAALFADPAYNGPIDGRNFAQIIRKRTQLSQADRDQVIALYDAEIRFTDEIVGQLLGHLERSGLRADTAIVITADHGEEFFEHGGWGHQSSLFDEQVRIPLIVHWPAAFEPRAVPDQVRLIDVMPTLLSIAGLRQQPASLGRSLVPLLMGDTEEAAPALSELLVDLRTLRSLREADWKYFDADRIEMVGGIDLSADPAESVLIQDMESVGEGLSRLRSEVQLTWDFGNKLVGRGTREIEIPKELQDKLRALGYTDE